MTNEALRALPANATPVEDCAPEWTFKDVIGPAFKAAAKALGPLTQVAKRRVLTALLILYPHD